MTTKETNPKDLIGSGKASITKIPHQVLGEVTVALTEGAAKYGPYNWRPAGARTSVYIDATWRHLAAFWEGQDIDPDSGLSHITKAMAGLIILRDSMLIGNAVDDRPPAVDPAWLAVVNLQTAGMKARYPEKPTEDTPEEAPEQWVPEEGDKYWTVACTGEHYTFVDTHHWCADSYDEDKLLEGLVFRTKEEAQAALQAYKDNKGETSAD